MASIFGSLAPRPGLFGQLGQGIHDNSLALMLGGAGMAMGQNPQQGFENLARGVYAGSQMDQGRRDRRKEAERMAALQKAMQSPAFQAMDPATREYAAQSPQFAEQILGQQYAPKPQGTSLQQEYQDAVSQ